MEVIQDYFESLRPIYTFEVSPGCLTGSQDTVKTDANPGV